MKPSLPSTIKIFLADGTPEGIRIVSKSNWTGCAVVANRSQLETAMQREEMARPGVYVLAGPGTDGGQKIYVGEADVLRDRIKQHTGGKDYWNRFMSFSCTDGTLNKAHVRYLEARLIALARKANQWKVENGSTPAPPPLSEMDKADAEGFLTEMLVIFPILGIDAFESASEDIKLSTEEDLFLDERGAKGRGQEVSGGFVVRKGSRARLKEMPSALIHRKDLCRLRAELVDRKVLVPEGDALVFTQDYRFSSPSMASCVLVGGSSNGRTAWKTAKGKTLKEIQEDRLGVSS